MRPATIAAWASALAALATVGLEPLSLPLHDAIARRMPVRPLPAVVVTVDGDVDAASAAVRAAGASDVWIALPDGDPRLGGARPDPGTLRAGADGRIRWDGDRRLPLPEALDGLLRVHVAQLGPGTPTSTLEGRDAVLVWSDPATGRREAAPGSAAPVDRGALLAVALGTARADAPLRVLPLAAAALLVAATTYLWSLLCTRWLPTRGLTATLVAAPLVGLACGAARAAGWDLPVGGLVLGIGAAATGRTALAASDALGTLDRVLLWLGAPPEDPGRQTGLGALAAMVEVHAPNVSVGVWRRVPGAAPEPVEARVKRVPLPDLEAIPAVVLQTTTSLVVPVRDRSEVVGALVLADDEPLSAELVALARTLAQAPLHAGAAPPPTSSDPFAARLELARVAVRRALMRAERWEALLGSTGGTLGMFDLSGGLVTGSDALRALTGDGTHAPLLAALAATSHLDAAEVQRTIRTALAGDRPVRVPARSGVEEVVLTPLGPTTGRTGLLLALHDISDHRRVDQLKTSVITATSSQLRDALDALEGLATQTAEGIDQVARRAVLSRVRALVDRSTAALDRAEHLAVAGADEAPLEPVYLHECVLDAAASLGVDRRARLTLDLPVGTAPVAARRDVLTQAVALLLGEATEHTRALVQVIEEEQGVRLVVEDDGGALPEAVLAGHVDDWNPTSLPAAARRIVEAMGGTFTAEPASTTGTRYHLRLLRF